MKLTLEEKFYNAVVNKDVAKVRKLLPFVDINYEYNLKDNYTDKQKILFIAMNVRNIEILELLLSSKEIDVNFKLLGFSPIFYAMDLCKNLDMVLLYLKHPRVDPFDKLKVLYTILKPDKLENLTELEKNKFSQLLKEAKKVLLRSDEYDLYELIELAIDYNDNDYIKEIFNSKYLSLNIKDFFHLLKENEKLDLLYGFCAKRKIVEQIFINSIYPLIQKLSENNELDFNKFYSKQKRIIDIIIDKKDIKAARILINHSNLPPQDAYYMAYSLEMDTKIKALTKNFPDLGESDSYLEILCKYMEEDNIDKFKKLVFTKDLVKIKNDNTKQNPLFYALNYIKNVRPFYVAALISSGFTCDDELLYEDFPEYKAQVKKDVADTIIKEHEKHSSENKIRAAAVRKELKNKSNQEFQL